MALKTDYKDYQFQEGETYRKYRQILNDDGTVSFEDVTNYQQVGNRFSASDINATNTKVNEVDQTAIGLKTDVSVIDNKLGDQVIYELHDTTLNINTKSEGVPTETESVFPNAGSHNAIYRGKFLGNSVTNAQYQALKDGTFTDLFIGDYWTIGGINYRIASFDYFLNCGDTATTEHHAVIVPDTALYNHNMNDTNTTDGGYVGSKMYTEGLEQAKTTIKEAFSGHILSHRIYLTNAVANGKPSNGLWYGSEVELMCEEMIYGCGIFRPVPDGNTAPANYRVEKSQLPLFAHRPDLISNRIYSWLRDVVTATYFAYVDRDGIASVGSASVNLGVRPYFCIYGGN